MKILLIDVDGTNVKNLTTRQEKPGKIPPSLTPTLTEVVAAVREMAAGWQYPAVSIGYAGPVADGRPTLETHNFAPCCVGFDSREGFGRRVKVPTDNRIHEHNIGLAGLKGLGKKTRRRHASIGSEQLDKALQTESIILRSGTARFPKRLPPGVCFGHNPHAFIGGLRPCADSKYRYSRPGRQLR